MKRTLITLAALLLAPLAAQCAEPPPQPSTQPNILLVLADDLGFSDLGCCGGEIRTPNLDALAVNGVRFTQCYNSSRCCPSRASLLTGLYPHQAGIGRFVGPEGNLAGYRGRLSDGCVTLAEVLGPAGYGTYACGKWYVNEPGPIERGFEEFYGFVHGYAVNSWEPGMMIRLPKGRPQRSYAAGEYYATTAITDHALDFLDIGRQMHRPWLLYVAYQAPHFPLQAPANLAANYVATYERGWDVLRADRREPTLSKSILHLIQRETCNVSHYACTQIVGELRNPTDHLAELRKKLLGKARQPPSPEDESVPALLCPEGISLPIEERQDLSLGKGGIEVEEIVHTAREHDPSTCSRVGVSTYDAADALLHFSSNGGCAPGEAPVPGSG